MINDEKFLIAHIKIQAIDTTFLNICANLCPSFLHSSLTMLCAYVKVAGIGVRALSDLGGGGGGVLFARKNYIVPECFIVEIRFLLPQNVRKKHSFTILNIF